MNLDDTIVAIATPPGRGGIGVVRLAGPEARSIALPMLWLKHDLEPGHVISAELIEPRGASPELPDQQADSCGSDTLVRQAVEGDAGTLGHKTTSDETAREAIAAANISRTGPALNLPKGVSAPHGLPSRIDEVVVTYFAKPHSYTTDDIIEISAHGSPVVLRHIVELTLARGARLAEPGEFTMRAFLNGRIDLTQAEAVRDLVESQTLYQAKVAAQQLEGALSRRLQPIKQKLVELIALLEAGIDFAEDDVSVLPSEQILRHISVVREPLEELARSFAYGKMVHQGLTLAIVGRPNVGKSSLFNRLVERERAIVTATPGTTRDLVTETVSIGGIPVHLVDTAGIRRALDEAESIGIQKSMEAMADADLVLVVLDASQPVATEDQELAKHAEHRPTIIVENKTDLQCMDESETTLGFAQSKPVRQAQNLIYLRTSALTGEGIPELRAAILHHVSGGDGSITESGFLTNARHQSLVHDSIAAISSAETAVPNRVPHEMLLLDLYNALRPLDEITGATTNDDILDLIFSRFCIGK